jgi:hypothetical protein
LLFALWEGARAGVDHADGADDLGRGEGLLAESTVEVTLEAELRRSSAIVVAEAAVAALCTRLTGGRRRPPARRARSPTDPSVDTPATRVL